MVNFAVTRLPSGNPISRSSVLSLGGPPRALAGCQMDHFSMLSSGRIRSSKLGACGCSFLGLGDLMDRTSRLLDCSVWFLLRNSVVPRTVGRLATSQAHILHPFRCR